MVAVVWCQDLAPIRAKLDVRIPIQTTDRALTIMNETINPESLYKSIELGFSHAVKSSGKTTIHCSGQVAWDKDLNVVGDEDVGVQARQALANLRVVLESAGAQVKDVVRLRTYVVNHNPGLLEPIGQAIGEFYGDEVPAANTLIGVQSLALPEFLIEIEATAEISTFEGRDVES